MKNIIISDPSLRDGNHSVKHKISLDSIARYCKFADKANIPVVEVGHGNGLAASSLLIGKSAHTDYEILSCARENLPNTKISIHSIPGIATINQDIKMAIDCGVDIFRIATHCTEATISKTHIEYLKNVGKEVYGVLMMSALIDSKELTKQAKTMESYGAEAIIIMDSTGSYMASDVVERISMLKDNLDIPIGFHGHSNLGLSVSNSLIAVENGATIIDACICGFGAGAGNTPLELVIPVLEKNGYSTNINFSLVLKEAENVLEYLVPKIPLPNPVNILTGLHKIVGSFEQPIIKASKLYNIEYSSLIFEVGNRKLVAGQEDLVLDIARKLK